MNQSTPNTQRDQDPFYALSSEEREITFRGLTRTFTIKELSEEEASRVFDIHDKQGKRDQEKAKNVRAKIIAGCVQDQYGAIDFDRAKKLPNQLANLLQDEALDVNGFGKKDGDEAKDDLENA